MRNQPWVLSVKGRSVARGEQWRGTTVGNGAHRVHSTRAQRPNDFNQDFRLHCSYKATGPCLPDHAAGPRRTRRGSPDREAQQGTPSYNVCIMQRFGGETFHVKTNTLTRARNVKLVRMWIFKVKVEFANLYFKVKQKFSKTFPTRPSFPERSVLIHTGLECFERKAFEALLE